MRKYLTFKSVGGGAGASNSAGEYVLSIDDIVGLGSFDTPAGSLKILLPNPWPEGGGQAFPTALVFTVTGTNGPKLLYEAIFNQIAAAPGGNFELIIPEGITITSFEINNNPV
jgi:hypothetical protein